MNNVVMILSSTFQRIVGEASLFSIFASRFEGISWILFVMCVHFIAFSNMNLISHVFYLVEFVGCEEKSKCYSVPLICQKQISPRQVVKMGVCCKVQ